MIKERRLLKMEEEDLGIEREVDSLEFYLDMKKLMN